MTRNRWKYAASSLAALMLLATVGGRPAGAASTATTNAKKKGVGKSVESNEITDGTIACEDISPSVFPHGCPDTDEVDVGAQNVFVDGFTTTDQDLPSTPSANVPEAAIAKLDVGEGSQVIFASIVWSGSPLNFSGIVTCHLVPPNGPNSKAEFIETGGGNITTGTLFVTTTNSGPGTVEFRCSDQSEASVVKYRFLQLTAIQVPSLTRTKLVP